jgi:hypothetical protein
VAVGRLVCFPAYDDIVTLQSDCYSGLNPYGTVRYGTVLQAIARADAAEEATQEVKQTAGRELAIARRDLEHARVALQSSQKVAEVTVNDCNT